MTYTVPLQEQFGDAGVDPQQVTKGHHTATCHIVATQTQCFYTAISHNTLKQIYYHQFWNFSGKRREELKERYMEQQYKFGSYRYMLW